MPFTLTMPKLSPTMEDGTIVKWCKKEGDRVEAGDTLMEVATDKATVEHTALDEGWLRKILIPEGGEAIVNQAVAIFTEEEKESIEGYEPEGAAPEPESGPAEETAEAVTEAAPKRASAGGAMAQPVFKPVPPFTDYKFPTERSAGERVKASPLARKLAAEKGLDITSVQGSGPGGRVMERDLAKAQAAGPVGLGRHEVPSLPPGSYEEEKLTPMRKTIGRRLQESKTFIPHFYVTQEVDAEPIISLRTQLKEAYGQRLSVTDFIVRAAALALRKHPHINSGFNTENDTIIRFETIDVAIAVSVDQGLLTPVIRHTDYKTIGQISTEMRDLAKRGRTGALQPEEYAGGSFTISNLGMYGITDFVAVINPPQASILAVGGVRDVPVVKSGEVVPGKRMQFTLSSDHRVVDGLDAAEFLQTLRTYLENPAGLLV